MKRKLGERHGKRSPNSRTCTRAMCPHARAPAPSPPRTSRTIIHPAEYRAPSRPTCAHPGLSWDRIPRRKSAGRHQPTIFSRVHRGRKNTAQQPTATLNTVFGPSPHGRPNVFVFPNCTSLPPPLLAAAASRRSAAALAATCLAAAAA